VIKTIQVKGGKWLNEEGS